MADAAIFFDRDGTLIRDPGYLNHPDQVQLLEGAAEALKELQQMGYKRVVVSNQSGVARGIVSVEMLERIHDRLRELLAVKGASLNGIYYCPYHPDGVIPEYRKDSDWRKPRPGMLLAAAKEMEIDLAASWMIGDNARDMEAGRSAGCRTVLIRAGAPGAGPSEVGQPNYVAVNMKEAINIIKQYRRSLPENRALPTAAEDPLATRSAEILSMAEDDPPGESGQEPAAAPPGTGTTTDRLLASILEQLRRMQQAELFGEFSLLRVLAGIVQVFVPFCLLLALWFLMRTNRQDNNVFLALGFAAVLQLMALTFYIMHGHR